WQVSTPQTNIVLISVADLTGTLQRFEASGVRAVPMAGQVRLMTHADLTDADIATALERIWPVDAAAGRSVGHRPPVRPGRSRYGRRTPVLQPSHSNSYAVWW